MIRCDKCGFGHETVEGLKECKSWAEMQADESAESVEIGKVNRVEEKAILKGIDRTGDNPSF